MSKINEVYELIVKSKMKLIGPAVEAAVQDGDDPSDILNKGMIAAMDEVGAKFTAGRLFVPEMLMSARTMKKGVEALAPYLKGDSSGFEVIDLGVDVSKEDFIKAVKENPDTKLVCCSALLTTTMPAIKDTVDAFNEAGLRDSVKIMVGGAPITQKFCDEIGADAYTPDAAAAHSRPPVLNTYKGHISGRLYQTMSENSLPSLSGNHS